MSRTDNTVQWPEQQAVMAAWNNKHKDRSVPVWLDDDRDDDQIEFTHSNPFLGGTVDQVDRDVLIRVGDSWRCVSLSRITVHPRAAEMNDLAPLEDGPELDFPPPDCAYCEIGLNHDGDGWNCEQCHAWWPSNGQSSGHRRYCVEQHCQDNYATTIGDDGQPRCASCAFLITLGVIEATGPYACTEPFCSEKRVTGIPSGSEAYRYRLCGRHNEHRAAEARWKDYRRRHPVTASAVGGVL